jgi:hypothetical protein
MPYEFGDAATHKDMNKVRRPINEFIYGGVSNTKQKLLHIKLSDESLWEKENV